MLKSMRKGSQNILVKGLLAILAGSFIVWGIGDIFRGGSSSVVAKVGSEEIGYSEYSNVLRRQIASFQQVTGASMTEEQFKQFDIKNRVFQQLVDNAIIRMRVGELNLKVGDAVAREQIASNEDFFDEKGAFSPERFKAILRENGMNENNFIVSLKEDAVVGIFLETFSVVPASFKTRSYALYKHRNENRFADLVYIPVDYIKEVAEPSETDLVQYYQDNTDKFAIPERRDVSYFFYGINDVKKSVEVSEEALKAEYDLNIKSFAEPEKRDVVQYLFSDEAEVKAAFLDIKSGKASAYEDKKIALGEVGQDGLPEELQAAVFNLKQGEFSEPVKSQLGWHIFIVNKIIEPKTKPFEEVRKNIENEMKESKSAQIFEESAVKIEDEFAAGLSLEDVSKKFDIAIHKASSIGADGQDANGKPLEGVLDTQTFADLAFSSDKGAVSPMTLLSDNSTYVVVRVDGVSPKRVKALDEVRGTAVLSWKDMKKAEKLEEAAKAVAQKIKNGEDPKTLAESTGLKFKPMEKITKSSVDSSLQGGEATPVGLVNEIFAVSKGGSSSYYLSSNGEYVVGKLMEVKAAELDAEKITNLESELKNNFTDDIFMQYNRFLREQYPVKVNETLLNQFTL